MTKHSNYSKQLLVVVFLITSLSYLVFNVPTAQAAPQASMSSSPFVVIAVDETFSAGCKEKFDLNRNTLHRTVTELPCPAGTVIGSVITSLASAVHNHESYVYLPTKNTTSAELSSFQEDLQSLMQATGNKIIKHNSAPLLSTGGGGGGTACGASSTFSASWHPQYSGNNFVSSIDFYKTLDCQTVTLQQSHIYVSSYDSWQDGPLQWTNDKYAAGSWWAGNVNLYVGNFYSHSINSNHTAGYYFETWVNEWINDTNYDVNIGPVD